MKLTEKDEESKKYEYTTKIELLEEENQKLKESK